MKQLIKKRFLCTTLIFSLIISSVITGCSSGDKTTTDNISNENTTKNISFDDYCQQLFVETATSDALTLNYLISDINNFDISDYPTVMLDFDSEDIALDKDKLSQIRQQLDIYDYNSLDKDQQITYDSLEYYLKSCQLSDGLELYMEPLGPTIGIQAELPITLSEYTFYTSKDIERYLTALPTIYDLFEEIMKFEEKKSQSGLFMSDDSVNNVLEQCNEFISKKEDNYLITSFNSKIDNYNGLTDEEKNSYKEKNKDIILNKIIPAYKLIIDGLNELMTTGCNTGGLCNLPLGKQYYEYLVHSKVGTDESVSQITTNLENYITSNMSAMYSISSKDSDIYQKAKDAKVDYNSPKEMLETLSTKILDDFPDVGNIEYELKDVDKSLEDYLSPAMYYKPPVDTSSCNSIYINNAKTKDSLNTFLTLAHEGFPGHMYEYNYIKSQKNYPLRQALDITGVSEGWAKYAEYNAYRYCNLDENVADFLYANSKIALCVEARAEIGVNYEGWEKSEVYDYVSKFFKINKDTADSIFQSAIETPANTLSYAYGEYIYSTLEENARSLMGDKFVLKDFRTFLLDIGIAPFPVIKERFKEYSQN